MNNILITYALHSQEHLTALLDSEFFLPTDTPSVYTLNEDTLFDFFYAAETAMLCKLYPQLCLFQAERLIGFLGDCATAQRDIEQGLPLFTKSVLQYDPEYCPLDYKIYTVFNLPHPPQPRKGEQND